MVRRAGLSFGSPAPQDISLGQPSVPFSPGSVSVGGSPVAPDTNTLVNSFANQISRAAAPQETPTLAGPRAPRAYFSESTGRMHVGGFTFEERDASAALQSRQYMTQGSDSPPPQDAEDWRPLGPGEYEQYIDEIVNPGGQRLFTEGFERGVRGLQTIGGAGLQFLGAEQLGGDILEDAVRGYQRNAPFERPFNEIDNASGAVDWFVSAFGEGLPSVLESVAVALAGAAAGSAGGPAASTAGALAGLFGKKAFRDQVLSAARRRLAGETLDAAEMQLLRRTAAVTGAAGATLANSYGMGVGDIYNEVRTNGGASAEDGGARALAAIGAVPYAVLESLPEFVAGNALFGGLRAGRGVLRGGATGAVVGAGLEGATEAGQEGINVLSASAYGAPVMTEENATRLLNAFAAGAAIGGPIGGVTGMASGARSDILTGGRPAASAATPAVPPASITPPTPAVPPAPIDSGAPAVSAPTTQASRQDAIGLPLFDFGGGQLRQAELFNTETLGVVAPDNRNVAGSDRAFTAPQGELFPGQNLGQPEQPQLPLQQPTAPAPGAAKLKRGKKPAAQAPVAAPIVSEPVPVRHAEGELGQNEMNFYQKSVPGQITERARELEAGGMPHYEAVTQATREVFARKDAARAADVGALGKTPKEEAAPTKADGNSRIKAAAARAKAAAEAKPVKEEKPTKPVKPLKAPKEEKPVETPAENDSEEEGKALVSAVRSKTRTVASVKSTVNGYVTRAKLAKGKAKYTLAQAEALKKRVYDELSRIAPANLKDRAKLEALRTKKAEEAKPKEEPAAREETKEAPVDDRTKRKFSEIEAAVKAYREASPDAKSRKLAELETEVRGKRDVARQWTLKNPGKESEEVRRFLDRGNNGPTRMAPSPDSEENAMQLIEDALKLWGDLEELPTGWKETLAENTDTRRNAQGRPRNDGVENGKLSPHSIEVYISNARAGKYGPRVKKAAALLPYAKRGAEGHVTAAVAKLMGKKEFMRSKGRFNRKAIWTEVNKQQVEAGAEPSSFNSVNQLVTRINTNRKKGNTRYSNAVGALINPMPLLQVKPFVEKAMKKVAKNVPYTALVYENLQGLFRANPRFFQTLAEVENGTKQFERIPAFIFQGKLIVLSNNVMSKEHLAFVMGHELVGHVGVLGSFNVGGKGDVTADFVALLQEAYKSSENIQDRADTIFLTGRAPNINIAIEEAIADIGGELEASLWRRIVVAVRRILHHVFGVTFEDELVHTILDQSRRYLKGKSYSLGTGKVPTRRAPAIALDEAEAAKRMSVLQSLAAVTSNSSTLQPNEAHGMQGFLDGARKNLKPAQLRDMLDAQKNKWLATLDDSAQKSPLLQVLTAVFQETAARRNDLVTEAQEMRVQTLKPELLGGPTTKEMEEAADMMTASTLHLHRQYSESKHNKQLVDIDDTGNGKFNKDVFDEYAALGTMSPEQFKKVITYFADGTEGWTPEFNVTAESKSYKVYLENRELVNYLLKQLLLDTIKGAGGVLSVRVKTAVENVSGLKRDLAADDLAWFDAVTHEYLKLYFEKQKEGEPASATKAELFLEDALKLVWLGKKQAEFIEAYGENPDMKGIIDGVSSIRKLGISKEEQIKLLGALQRIALDRATIRNAEAWTSKSLVSGYFPIMREGDYQVRIAVQDENGNHVNLDEDVKNKLNFYKASTIEDADELAKMLDEKLGDKVWDAYDERGQAIKVKFRSVREKAQQTAGLSEHTSVEQFKDVATRIGIRLTPDDIELIVTALTATGDKARRSLERSGTPGWNRDAVKAVSIWSEVTANTAAKRAHRFKLDNIMRNEELAYGSKTKLERLQKAFNDAKNNAAKIIAEQELLRYARMYSFVSPVVSGQKDFAVTTSRGELKFEHQGRGNEMRDLANVHLRQYHGGADLNETPVSELGGLAMTVATTMQLGGSVATGVLNTVALWTHFVPYMAESNPRYGRGGGFGDMRALAETMKALGHMANNKFSDRQVLEDIVNKKTWAANNLTEWEAKYLYNLSIRGTLDAQMNKALLGTTRSKITDRAWNEVIKRWMSFFSYTEQLNRRTAALAAIRLYYERFVAAGVDVAKLNDPNTEEYQKLLHEVERVINDTQFNYSNFNRPMLIKGPWFKLVLLYKMFIVGSLQLIKQLPARQQVQMLALMVVLAGLKGLPFAEDFMDLIDGLAQRLGIRMASVELAIAEFADALVPGSGKLLLNGVVNSVTGATIGTRLGFGDIIPFTGLLREDADLGRELESGFGPVYSAMRDSVNYAGFIADMAAQTVGLKDRVNEPGDLIRRAPISGIRQFEGIMWGLDNQVVDRQGRVVSENVPFQMAMLRLMGFYPNVATEQNDIVRLSRYVDNYTKRIAANYRNAYASARRTNNTARMREIENDVREWNRQAREAGQEEYVIENFRRNALRSASERNRSTLERYQRTTNKPTAERLAELYGLEEE